MRTEANRNEPNSGLLPATRRQRIWKPRKGMLNSLAVMKNKAEPPTPNKWVELPYLTKQQVAEMLQCTPRTIEKAVRQGRLRMLKVSSRLVRFRMKDIDEFLDSVASIRQVRPRELPKKVSQPIWVDKLRRRGRAILRGPLGVRIELVTDRRHASAHHTDLKTRPTIPVGEWLMPENVVPMKQKRRRKATA